METSYTNFQRHDPQMEMTSHLFDIESCVRMLLDVVASDHENDTRMESGLTFEVYVDGLRYTISILESPTDLDDSQQLTAREQDVVRLISKGLTTKTIASVLGLKPCTISTYTKRIYLKLNVNSRAEMVAKVLNKPSSFLRSMH